MFAGGAGWGWGQGQRERHRLAVLAKRLKAGWLHPGRLSVCQEKSRMQPGSLSDWRVDVGEMCEGGEQALSQVKGTRDLPVAPGPPALDPVATGSLGACLLLVSVFPQVRGCCPHLN